MPPSHIVISSESEKSFPFAVKPRMREQRITGNTMLHMNWTLRCFMQTDSHRKEETRSRKRSLGSARDDDTGRTLSKHSLCRIYWIRASPYHAKKPQPKLELFLCQKDLFAKLCEHGACCYCSTNNACYVRAHCLHQEVVGWVVFQAYDL